MIYQKSLLLEHVHWILIKGKAEKEKGAYFIYTLKSIIHEKKFFFLYFIRDISLNKLSVLILLMTSH